jgi:CspA family cold shock protein
MENGFCKFFDQTHGWGILVNEDSKNDIFVHHSDTLDKIKSSDQCTWEVEEGVRGLKAVEVRRIKPNEKH